MTQSLSAMMAIPIITIDGPTASGKGTIAKLLAKTLHFHYLDSGALYRLVAFLAIKNHIALNNTDALSKIALHLPCRFDEADIWLEEEKVTLAIRKEAVSLAASKIATLPAVREALLARQHAFATLPGLVADGRDMGTVIFPDAVLKVYLTASVHIRAQRRLKQLLSQGFSATMDDLVKDLNERDWRDQNRAISPLKPHQDAYILDTSTLNIEETIALILARYRSLTKKRSNG